MVVISDAMDTLSSSTKTMQTETSIEQKQVEDLCQKQISRGKASNRRLEVAAHVQFLRGALGQLSDRMVALDASRPWLVYWAINGLRVLGDDISDLTTGVSSTILSCLVETGGISGGFGQVPHVATSYAGLLALAACEDEEAYKKIDKDKWHSWLLSLKEPNGSFRTSTYGEADSRSTYCALVIASLLDILDSEITRNSVEYLASCQTYEGGFADNPYGEAHAGYAFCALAGLVLLIGDPLLLFEHTDVDNAVRWLSARQHGPEGGFSGRTNKLVDGCYNHWAGGCWPFLEAAIGHENTFDRKALKEFVLYCNQQTQVGKGGMCDKPGCHADTYHTNYVLAGLAGSQSKYEYLGKSEVNKNAYGMEWQSTALNISEEDLINQVNLIHPIYVIPVGAAEQFHEQFTQRTRD